MTSPAQAQPPWTVEELDARFVVKDSSGQKCASERTCKGGSPHTGGTGAGIHKDVLPQIQICERGGKFRTATALSIAPVLGAGHRG